MYDIYICMTVDFIRAKCVRTGRECCAENRVVGICRVDVSRNLMSECSNGVRRGRVILRAAAGRVQYIMCIRVNTHTHTHVHMCIHVYIYT